MKKQLYIQNNTQQQIPNNVQYQQLTKKCPFCQTDIPQIAKACPNCHKKVVKSSATPAIIIIFVIIALVVLLAALGSGQSSTDKNQGSTKGSLLSKNMELTEEQETKMKAIFEECGILELKKVDKFQESETKTSYHVDDVETQSYRSINNTIVVWVDNETKAVQEIYFNDKDIYRDGKVVAKVSDYYVSDKLRKEYRLTAEILINQYINFPDTAKYKSASGWKFGVQDGYDIVQSSVEAENAFKQKVTEDFQIKYDRKTGNPVSIIIGDQEYLG